MGVQFDNAESSVATFDPHAPIDNESAREYLTTRALKAGKLGTVGLELERHVVNVASPASVISWRHLQEAVTGLKLPHDSRLTLEPGGQLELSTLPGASVVDAVDALTGDDAVVQDALAEAGLGLLSIGTDPVRSPVRNNPGDRYAAMAAYFASAGHREDGATMMYASASLQVNIEAGPVSGWDERVAQVHRLTPALTALASSSPLLRGRDRGIRSERAAMWQRLDPSRCSPFVGHGDPAGAWASFALAAPVMLLRDPVTGRHQPIRDRVPLVSWLTGERELGGRRPTIADLDVHTTTLFPPVRLRGFLEIRLLDAVPARFWPGLAALTVAIMDDPEAAGRAAEAAEPLAKRSADAARVGISDPALLAAARGLVEAALPATPAPLRPAVEAWAELLESGRTPADLVLERARRDGPLACLTAPELS
jgi:ergothioneine biosynthesis glutamate--cysteine ligase EgtA